MGSLLSTQTLLDILGGSERTTAWFNSTPANEVQVSAVSIGQALTLIQRIEDTDRCLRFDNTLNSFVAIITTFRNVIGFDEVCARQWARLQEMDLPYVAPTGVESALSVASRMVVATALALNSTLVEPLQPYHERVPNLRIASP